MTTTPTRKAPTKKRGTRPHAAAASEAGMAPALKRTTLRAERLAPTAKDPQASEVAAPAKLRRGLLIVDENRTGEQAAGIVLEVYPDGVLYESIDGGHQMQFLNNLVVPAAGSTIDRMIPPAGALDDRPRMTDDPYREMFKRILRLSRDVNALLGTWEHPDEDTTVMLQIEWALTLAADNLHHLCDIHASTQATTWELQAPDLTPASRVAAGIYAMASALSKLDGLKDGDGADQVEQNLRDAAAQVCKIARAIEGRGGVV